MTDTGGKTVSLPLSDGFTITMKEGKSANRMVVYLTLAMLWYQEDPPEFTLTCTEGQVSITFLGEGATGFGTIMRVNLTMLSRQARTPDPSFERIRVALPPAMRDYEFFTDIAEISPHKPATSSSPEDTFCP